MKALKYVGLAPGTHTTMHDARTAQSGFQGVPIDIRAGDVVPLAAYCNAEWSGDVAAIHVAMGLAVEVDVPEEAPAPAEAEPEPEPEPKPDATGDEGGM